MKTKKPRKTLGQIAYESSNALDPFIPKWKESVHQAEYEEMALAVAKEVLRRAKAGRNYFSINISVKDVK